MNITRETLQNYLRRILSTLPDPAETTFSVRLPSVLAEAQFRATVTIVWPPRAIISHHRQAVAQRRLLDRVRSTASSYSVLDPDEARAAVNLALWDCGQECADLGLMEATATIEVGPDDQRLAEEREGLRRQTALARETRLEEVERLRMLADQILATPTTAQLWWLDGNPGKLEDLVSKSKANLFENVAKLFGSPTEKPEYEPIAELVRLFLTGLDARFREQLISQLRFIFTSYEHGNLARMLDDYQHPRANPDPDVRLAEVGGRASGPDLSDSAPLADGHGHDL